MSNSKVTEKHINACIIGMWRCGAKPLDIWVALYEGIHSTNYIEMVIKNYLNQVK